MSVLERARRAAGLTQTELAERAKTSRTAVSAYEHGRKSPSLSTFERLLEALGYEVEARPRPSFATVSGRGGREYVVPDRLPDLPVERRSQQSTCRCTWTGLHRSGRRPGRTRAARAVLRDRAARGRGVRCRAICGRGAPCRPVARAGASGGGAPGVGFLVAPYVAAS
ncbi:MAG: helix-turn-helix domain-containing protein [Phycicoccus sp.]